jgi:hypothetical protein
MLWSFHGQDNTDYTEWLAAHPREFTIWLEEEFRIVPDPGPDDEFAELLPGKSGDARPTLHRASCGMIQQLAGGFQATCGTRADLELDFADNPPQLCPLCLDT